MFFNGIIILKSCVSKVQGYLLKAGRVVFGVEDISVAFDGTLIGDGVFEAEELLLLDISKKLEI